MVEIRCEEPPLIWDKKKQQWVRNAPLSVNESDKMYWKAKVNRLADWRRAVWDAWITSPIQPFEEKARITVFLPFTREGRRDPANYHSPFIKALVDELACPSGKRDRKTKILIPSCRGDWPACGHAVPDDDERYVEQMPPVFVYGEDSRLVVRFEPMS